MPIAFTRNLTVYVINLFTVYTSEKIFNNTYLILFQRSENVDLSLSISQTNFQSNGYDMSDQVSFIFTFLLLALRDFLRKKKEYDIKYAGHEIIY